MSTPNLAMSGNPRYQPKSLQPIFGYDNLMRPVAEVEVATLEVLGELGIVPAADFKLLTPKVVGQLLDIRTSAVDEVERKITKHDIRAWVRLAQEIVAPPLRPWIHVPLTSYDPLDTARSLQFSQAYCQVLEPAIREVVGHFIDLIENFSGQLQIGRTHGQHALPITVGFWLATILNRILYNARMIQTHAAGLVGKVSGAVGAYNAQVGLGITERCQGGPSFEARVLKRLDLSPALISTQILPPEPMSYFLHACIELSAALGQLGRDGRNLMRTEIGEVVESFEKGQVGSSTMAHKRNPINFENLEGTWLKTKSEFGKVLDTLISDHQRDLVNSSLFRDFPTIVINLTHQLNVLLRKNDKGVPFLLRISVDQEACERNAARSGRYVMAEPLYLSLQMAGYEKDAHELVNRQAMPIAQEQGISLLRAVEVIAKTEPDVQAALDGIPAAQRSLLESPEAYIGEAPQKAAEVVALARQYLERSA